MVCMLYETYNYPMHRKSQIKVKAVTPDMSQNNPRHRNESNSVETSQMTGSLGNVRVQPFWNIAIKSEAQEKLGRQLTLVKYFTVPHSVNFIALQKSADNHGTSDESKNDSEKDIIEDKDEKKALVRIKAKTSSTHIITQSPPDKSIPLASLVTEGSVWTPTNVLHS